MWTIEQLVKRINDFQNIIYAVGFVFLILFIIVVYNLISINYLKRNNEKDHNNQILSIAMNKHNIKMLRRYIDEENTEDDALITENKSNIDKNSNKIELNQGLFESTKAKFNESIITNKSDISTMKADILSNDSKISTLNTEFGAYQTSQADMIESITTNQNNIQANIATFKYSDFEILRSNVNQNNRSVVNLETNIHSNFVSIGDIEEELDVMNNKYLPINSLQGHLDTYYTTDLLPKFDSLDYLVASNISTSDQIRTDLTNNYTTSAGIDTQFESMTSNLTNNYMTTAGIDTQFESMTSNLTNNYMTSAGIDTQFASMTSNLTNDYMTSSEIDLRFQEIQEEY